MHLSENKKSIRTKTIGGRAGGEKYIVHNILFKFAVDAFNLFGGSTWAAAKVFCFILFIFLICLFCLFICLFIYLFIWILFIFFSNFKIIRNNEFIFCFYFLISMILFQICC